MKKNLAMLGIAFGLFLNSSYGMENEEKKKNCSVFHAENPNSKSNKELQLYLTSLKNEQENAAPQAIPTIEVKEENKDKESVPFNQLYKDFKRAEKDHIFNFLGKTVYKGFTGEEWGQEGVNKSQEKLKEIGANLLTKIGEKMAEGINEVLDSDSDSD